MKILLDKKNRRQLIIAGIITVFIAMIPTIANIPVTYAEKTSPDGKYKLVAKYSLLEELSCSLSIAGSGDQNGTLFLKSSDGKVLAQTAIAMQEFQPEAVKWHSDYVEMNYIKWFYDGKIGEVLDPALFFRNVSLSEAAGGIADVAENKTLNLFTANAIQGKNEFEKFKKIFELLQEMQVLIDKGITPPPALFAAPPDKKFSDASDYRQIMNDLWNLQADNYRIFADFMEKHLTRRLLFHEYLGKFLSAPDRKNNYSNHIAEAYLRFRITIPQPQEHRERIARQVTDSFVCQYATHNPEVLTGLSPAESEQLQAALTKNNDFMGNNLAVTVNYFQKFPKEKNVKKLLQHYYPQKQYPPLDADGDYLHENYSLGFKLVVYHILLKNPKLRNHPENRVWCQSLYTGFGYYPDAKNWKK
jgi:hypothetical protein